MRNPYVNKLGMYLVVLTVTDAFSALFAAIPAAVRQIAHLKELVAEIQSRSGEVEKGTSGETNAKTKAEDDMSEAVSILVGMLNAYADDTGDQELYRQTLVSDSEIDHTRDAARASLCTSQIDMVEAHKAALVDWGVSDADIAEARALIKAYEDSLGKRGSTATGHTGSRKSIATLFTTADRILKKQLDKVVDKLKNPDLSQAYYAARVIHDVAATRKVDIEPTPAPSEVQTK